ncbi:protein Churchill-like [Dysidea avara]|uniref:protein Churchill-like n=1 Tax=Dysidea avara TaxID=196820 RepID=UPI00331CFA82
MCINCLKTNTPDRGSTCLEKGAYLMNFAGCHACKNVGFLKEESKVSEEDDDGEETVTYNHVCKECDHIVASHEYTFSVDDGFQEYSMNCTLCGYGSATVSILPDDPREKQLF